MEWAHATLVRLSLSEETQVIAGLKRMKPASEEAQKLIDNAIEHLTKHSGRLDYASAKRGGYHIGSGAIESANKMICHGRLKRTGAWWYPTCANNVLKLRCARYNGTYDRVIELYRERHPITAVRRGKKRDTAGTPEKS